MSKRTPAEKWQMYFELSESLNIKQWIRSHWDDERAKDLYNEAGIVFTSSGIDKHIADGTPEQNQRRVMQTCVRLAARSFGGEFWTRKDKVANKNFSERISFDEFSDKAALVYNQDGAIEAGEKFGASIAEMRKIAADVQDGQSLMTAIFLMLSGSVQKEAAQKAGVSATKLNNFIKRTGREVIQKRPEWSNAKAPVCETEALVKRGTTNE